MVFADGVPPSLDLNGRSYSQMVKARKFGYKVHKQEQEDFEASQSTGNKLRGEKLAQDKHDADVAGIDYESRKDLLDENEMTTSAADRARGADIDNTDMQSQEQQDEAEADTNGFSKFVDELGLQAAEAAPVPEPPATPPIEQPPAASPTQGIVQ